MGAGGARTRMRVGRDILAPLWMLHTHTGMIRTGASDLQSRRSESTIRRFGCTRDELNDDTVREYTYTWRGNRLQGDKGGVFVCIDGVDAPSSGPEAWGVYRCTLPFTLLIYSITTP